MDEKQKTVKRIGSFTGATMISRILGYIRDALVAYAFGGTVLTDAFYAAFRIPNLLRRLLGEGSLSASFVPVFTQHLSTSDKEETKKFVNSLFTALVIILALIVIAGVILAPYITRIVVWGFADDPAKFNLTTSLTRIIFPFLFFISIAALTSSILNSLGVFFIPALAPCMLSVAEITFILTLASRFKNPIQGLAISAVAGGALHLLIQLPKLKKHGFSFRPNFKIHPSVYKVGKLMIPAVWGLSIDQINAFVDTMCASFLVIGSVTALYNSNRIMQLPLALFGIAIATVALPSLSKSAANKNFDEFKNTLNFSLRLMLFAVIPASIGLIALGLPVIRLLFEHGRFTYRESLLTNTALLAYSTGLVAYSAVKILVNSFYSLQNTKTPVKVATLCMILNIAGNLTLMWRWGVGGLAMATALASWTNAIVLFILINKKLGPIDLKSILRTAVLSLTASIIMISGCLIMAHKILPENIYIMVPATVIFGIIVYFLLTNFFKMEERKYILKIISSSE
jgi:putative peptidoglycan lipid II flippase